MKLLNPKNDYTFKRIFGFVGNENITRDLISTILDENIKSVKLDCKEILEKDIKSDKLGILDIKAIADDSSQIDIEMQRVDNGNIEERILFYWSKMYVGSIKEGKNYKNSKRTIVILFTNYEIAKLNSIQKYISKWHIREDEYVNMVLTNKLEIVIIEIPKYRRLSGNNKKLNTWLKFIDNPGGIEMEDVKENKVLNEAKETLEKISMDENEQELEFKREIFLMDMENLKEYGYELGKKDGINEGIKEGIKEGEMNEKIKTAKKMLEKGINIEIISECTSLTKEEIETINN